MKLRYITVSIPILLLHTSTLSQIIPPPSYVEYNGAVLDNDRDYSIYPSGSVRSANLKFDYREGGIVFAANTRVVFSRDGRVIEGWTKVPNTTTKLQINPGPLSLYNDGSLRQAIVKEGYRDQNILLPKDSTVTFSPSGRILNIEIDRATFFGMTVTGVVWFRYNDLSGSYTLLRGQNIEPQLVANVITKREPEGAPVNSIPIVMPPLSRFEFAKDDLDTSFTNTPGNQWTWPQGDLLFNGDNYGDRPTLIVDKMQLLFIRVTREVVIRGFKYPAGTVIRLDSSGNPTRS
jgi:hypothetical protein